MLALDFNGHTALRLTGRGCFQLAPVADKPGPVTGFIVSRRTPEQAGGGGWQRLVSIRSGAAADNKPPNLCLSAEAQSDAYAPSVKVMS
mgnify:CR=1 FL=1